MGAGCSSPLRRFGGRKSKPTNRESISVEDNDNLDQLTIADRSQQRDQGTSPLTTTSQCQHSSGQHDSNSHNEITIQSGAVDDEPSSVSCHIDRQTQGGCTQSSNVDQQNTDSNLNAQSAGKEPSGATAKVVGLSAQLSHDRHLLVSPALSSAPSMCQSPASNSSMVGGSIALDLNDSNNQSIENTHQKSVTTSAQTNQKQNMGPSYQMQQQQQCKQKIYTINDNHRHVVVTHPDKNSLSVWDIFEEKVVRTINNVDQPRDLRMIDHKRAVVLCNRELRVYDLDSGQLLTKLKGVMNQKMPYFEVFGQDYVIALARNRMYVNMLNLNTGELETTFKVGEDRFLNSLLVSR